MELWSGLELLRTHCIEACRDQAGDGELAVVGRALLNGRVVACNLHSQFRRPWEQLHTLEQVHHVPHHCFQHHYVIRWSGVPLGRSGRRSTLG